MKKQSLAGRMLERMNLHIFCLGKKVGQDELCAALNCVCSCLEGLDVEGIFSGEATNGNNKGAFIAI
jgi:hypothetical protein